MCLVSRTNTGLAEYVLFECEDQQEDRSSSEISLRSRPTDLEEVRQVMFRSSTEPSRTVMKFLVLEIVGRALYCVGGLSITAYEDKFVEYSNVCFPISSPRRYSYLQRRYQARSRREKQESSPRS